MLIPEYHYNFTMQKKNQRIIVFQDLRDWSVINQAMPAINNIIPDFQLNRHDLITRAKLSHRVTCEFNTLNSTNRVLIICRRLTWNFCGTELAKKKMKTLHIILLILQGRCYLGYTGCKIGRSARFELSRVWVIAIIVW